MRKLNGTVRVWERVRVWRPSLVEERDSVGKRALLTCGKVPDLHLNTQAPSLMFKSVQDWKLLEYVEKPCQIPPHG